MKSALAAALLAGAFPTLPAFSAVPPSSAEAELSRGLAALPETLLSAHHRAVARWGMGMYETAADGFEAVLKAVPDQPAALANLAAVRLLQHRPRQAAELLNRALARLPRSPRLLYLRARAARALDDDARAVELLRAACAVDPRETGLSLSLAEALAAQGHPSEAEAELRRLLSADPEYGPALFRLARLLDARGERAESTRLLRRFSAADGRSAAKRCRYDEPVEPPLSAPEPGPNWVSVRVVRARKNRTATVTAYVGRLVLRTEAGDAPVRLRVGDRGPLDALRVDWSDGTHSYRVDVATGQTVVVEEAATHVW